MNPLTEEQRLEEKIREAVPESMECRYLSVDVVETDFEESKTVKICIYCHAEDETYMCLYGRPLNLADLVYVITKKYRDEEFPDESLDGEEAQHLYVYSYVCKLLALWDLKQDFHNQKPEFYEFLSSLLLP